MLHYECLSPATLELLKTVQTLPVCQNLRLVGGTGLALQIGHRISADIDLFGQIEADQLSLNHEIQQLGDVRILHNTENIHIYQINNVKVDIVNYSYQWLEELVITDGLKMAGI